MAQILDGKGISDLILEESRADIERLRTTHSGYQPKLVVVLIGDDPASHIYVANKEKTCTKLGIAGEVIRLPAQTSQADVLGVIARLNADSTVNGILVQSPPPPHIDEWSIIQAIDPRKDVDGFHPSNLGALFAGKPHFVPCTPLGVMVLLERYGISVAGKSCVVIGRSTIVGRPMAALLINQHATVTITHSKTVDLPGEIKRADIVIACLGKPRFVKAEWLKQGAVVIDVGINRLPDGKLVGDVDFDPALSVASAITPVPKGIGPMTIAMLMRNTIQAFRLQHAAQHEILHS